MTRIHVRAALALLLSAAALAAPAAARAEREPMRTELRTVDGTPVVFQYGIPVPAFDGWRPGAANGTRDVVGLDRSWRFRFEDGVDGVAAGWHEPGFDDSSWEDRPVPSSWDLYDTPGFGGYDGSRYGQGTAFKDGSAWYRVRVDVPRRWEHRRVLLKFLAVSYRADVWINGEHAGTHEGGSAPFALDAGERLRPGARNVIAVRVYRRPWWSSYTAASPQQISDDREIPHKPVDYWPYAGIVRSAWLEATSPVTISKALVSGDAGERAVTVRAVVENRSDRARVARVALLPDGATGGRRVAETVELAPGAVRVVTLRRSAPRAKPWSPDDPALYDADLRVTAAGVPSDELTTRYGFRDVAVEGGRLTVNGEPVFLKGVNWHEETPERGRSLTLGDYDRLLGDVPRMGANFIRNAVYTRHPYVYDWADRHGVYVMDDIDTMWLNEPQQRFQLSEYGLSRALALTMAWNQANHPSVILWCLQNESEMGPSYRAWIADMKEAARAADPQDRPITWASASSNDPAFDLADVVGFNEYFGYFYGRDEDLGPTIDATRRAHPTKPILITENGTFSYPGRHGSPDEMGTEEWQAEKLRRHWAQVVARPETMAGYTYWLLRDYKQRMAYNRFDYNGISAMGMMDFSGEPRLAFSAYGDAQPPGR